jgi:hypothetical protein
MSPFVRIAATRGMLAAVDAAGHAWLLDVRTSAWVELVPPPGDVQFVDVALIDRAGVTAVDALGGVWTRGTAAESPWARVWPARVAVNGERELPTVACETLVEERA